MTKSIFPILALVLLSSGRLTAQKEFYEIRVYELRSAEQVGYMDQFLSRALVPALHRQGEPLRQLPRAAVQHADRNHADDHATVQWYQSELHQPHAQPVHLGSRILFDEPVRFERCENAMDIAGEQIRSPCEVGDTHTGPGSKLP